MPAPDALRPMCFIAMPFGTRPAKRGMKIDFNRVHQFIQRGAEAAGFEAIRADFETSGGFIHKAMFERLLVAYEQGFRTDLRDYYPGVNGVTLRLFRGTEDDYTTLKALMPVVRYSVASAPAPKNTEERYWQTATKLELAMADRDWKAAHEHFD